MKRHARFIFALGYADGVKAMSDEWRSASGQVRASPRVSLQSRLGIVQLPDQREAAAEEATALVEEYYGVLGLTPSDVFGRNAAGASPCVAKDKDVTDTVKHLADTLDLLAPIGRTVQASGRP